MRTYRCYTNIPTLRPASTIELDEAEARHLATVRRVQTGHHVILVNGQGTEARAVITELRKKTVSVRIEEILRHEAESPARVTLACALTKGPDLDDMFHRAVELGISAFVPLLTERTTIDPDERQAARRLERWQRLAIEALKQCERLWLPDIHPPIPLAELLTRDRTEPAKRILLHERQLGTPNLRELLARSPFAPVTIIIGPEGGWSPGETDLARDASVPFATLGSEAILRTETAALAALSIALSCRAHT